MADLPAALLTGTHQGSNLPQAGRPYTLGGACAIIRKLV